MGDNYEYNIKELIEAHKLLQKEDPSRENAIVITKLQEALLWHNEGKRIKQEQKPKPPENIIC